LYLVTHKQNLIPSATMQALQNALGLWSSGISCRSCYDLSIHEVLTGQSEICVNCIVLAEVRRLANLGRCSGGLQNSIYIGQCEPKLHIHCRFAARNFIYIEAVRAKTLPIEKVCV
jgi:hypothetical protein